MSFLAWATVLVIALHVNSLFWIHRPVRQRRPGEMVSTAILRMTLIAYLVAVFVEVK